MNLNLKKNFKKQLMKELFYIVPKFIFKLNLMYLKSFFKKMWVSLTYIVPLVSSV